MPSQITLMAPLQASIEKNASGHEVAVLGPKQMSTEEKRKHLIYCLH